MRKAMRSMAGMTLGLMVGVVLLTFGVAMAEHVDLPIEKVVSQGVVTVVDAEGQILILQKDNGRKVSLEVTQETQLYLNGAPRGVELLEELQAGKTVVSAEHYTNDAGMQQVVRLDVLKLK